MQPLAVKILGATSLEPAQARMLSRLCNLPIPAGCITRHHAGVLLIGDLLLRHGMKLEHVATVLTEIAPSMERYLEAPDQLWTLQILDGQYCVWPDSPGTLDYQAAAFTTHTIALPITSLAICLTGLLSRVILPSETTA